MAQRQRDAVRPGRVDLAYVLPALPGLVAGLSSLGDPADPLVQWCIAWWWLVLAASVPVNIAWLGVRAVRNARS